MKITYNNIIKQLKAFFDSHLQVNDFKNGDLWEAIESNSFNDALYPLAFLVDNGGNTSQGKVGLTFDLLCMDLVDKDEANENEVKSDTLRILLDAVAYLEQLRDGNWYNVQVEKQSALSSFTEKFQDELTGWKITITLSQPFSYNACQIPYNGVAPEPEPEPTCDPSIINQSDNTLIAEVQSGETYNVEDSDISINGNLFESVKATDDLNIEVRQSTGNTLIGSKQGQYYRIGDSLIQLDGADGLELVRNLKATDGLILKITNEDLETIPQVYVDGNNLVVEDKGIFNSNNTFSQAIDYIGDNILSDVTHTDSDGSGVTLPAMIPMVCTPTRENILRPIKTGNASYIAGDDGETQAGRGVDFFTLDFVNPYGNTTRFTNDLGGLFNDNSDGSTVGYIVDNATSLGWSSIPEPVRTTPNHLLAAQTHTVGSYGEFRMANFREYFTINGADNISTFKMLPCRSVFGNMPSTAFMLNEFTSATKSYRAVNNALQILNTTFAFSTLFVRNHTY